MTSMYFQVFLPVCEPSSYDEPTVCPTHGCTSGDFRLRQTTARTARGVGAKTILARRYRCKKCGHTFRVYPAGIDRARIPKAWRCIGLMLYAMGLSYGNVTELLGRLGFPLSKGGLYKFAQAAGPRLQELRELRRQELTVQSSRYQEGYRFSYGWWRFYASLDHDPNWKEADVHIRALILRTDLVTIAVQREEATRSPYGHEPSPQRRSLLFFDVAYTTGEPRSSSEVQDLVNWFHNVATTCGVNLVPARLVLSRPKARIKS